MVLEKTFESPLDSKEIKLVNSKGNQWIFIHWRDWCWGWSSNSLATWCEELTHWKRPWCWEWLKMGGKGDDGGWDGLMASLTQWIWVWVSSGSWSWTGKPGILQSMESQRLRRKWGTELNWNSFDYYSIVIYSWQSGYVMSPALFFLLKTSLTSQGFCDSILI